uniref:TRF2/HOY1 PH-like domain-containing protein n=1 Tax=Leersia perrieri TaxID=77586 RepID=A0A0D9VM31_9ORYZ
MGWLQDQVLGKRPATPSPSPAMFKIEMEEEEEEDVDGDLHSHKRVKELHVPPPSSSQDMQILDESSPLGLRLRKSPSFVKLVQMCLDIENAKKKESKSRPCERVKASNFPANYLKIGTWEYTSQYEGDLVAKCYFAKNKLVWEVLDAGLKRKIEIQWSNITALKATCPENGIGTLDLTLSRPPIFFKETDPQPRKHTQWQAALDFTDGQASTNRSIFENPNELKCCNGSGDLEGEHEAHLSKYIYHVSPCGVSLMTNDGINDVIVNQQQSSSQPYNLEVNDVDFKAGVSEEPKDQSNSLGQLRSLSMNVLLSHLGDYIMEQKSTGNNCSLHISDTSSKELLEDINQHLLSDSQGLPTSDEKRLMAKVDSLLSLLQKDTVISSNFESSDSGKIGLVEVNSFNEESSLALI